MSATCPHCPHDRSRWPAGPWDTEPDRWEGRHAGLPIVLHRGPSGGWCGYAGVPPGHPYHGADYSALDIEDDYPRVHGGLTYADACKGAVCHVPAPGEPDDLWWFGFDCAHSGDLIPGLIYVTQRIGLPALEDLWTHCVYRTIDYARGDAQRLAAWLASKEA